MMEITQSVHTVTMITTQQDDEVPRCVMYAE